MKAADNASFCFTVDFTEGAPQAVARRPQDALRDTQPTEGSAQLLRKWRDVFPWLDEYDMWQANNDIPPDAWSRSEGLLTIADLAVTCAAERSIAVLFPRLPARADVASLRLSPPRLNFLRLHHLGSTADLRRMTPSNLAGLESSDTDTALAILHALAQACIPAVTIDQLPHDGAAIRLSSMDHRIEHMTQRAMRDLATVARWYSGIGMPGVPMLPEPHPSWCPEDVALALHRLQTLRACELVVPGTPETDLTDAIDLIVGGLSDPRFTMILGRRLFAPERASLNALGQELGLSRERVRQLEIQAREALMTEVETQGLITAVRGVLASIDSKVRPFDDVLASIPALDSTVPSIQQPVWRVFECLDGTFEIADGWWVRPSMKEAVEATKKALATVVNVHGVAPTEQVDVVAVSAPDALHDAREQWLHYCGIATLDEFALLNTGSMGDYAAAVLSVAGEALSSQEIVQRFEVERSDRSLRNQLSSDSRFDRVDRDRWALHEWGMETYAGIRDEIGERLDLHGGSMLLTSLIDELTRTFTVTPTSVTAYASAPPYQCRGGVVSRASADAQASKPPEKTARLFRVPDGWAYRMRVTADHLRGSGSQAPMAVAAILGLQFGQSRQLDSPLGPQSVYWTSIQPSFGTLRRFFTDGGIGVGTDAFVVIRDDGTFDVDPARQPTDDPLHEALRLIHGPTTDSPEEATRALARAIKLPDSSATARLIEEYEQRGDSDIAGLLILARNRLAPGETGHTADKVTIDEIMSLL